MALVGWQPWLPLIWMDGVLPLYWVCPRLFSNRLANIHMYGIQRSISQTHTHSTFNRLSLSLFLCIASSASWMNWTLCLCLFNFFFCRYIFCLLLFGFRPERPSFGFRMRVGFISGTSNEMQPNRPCGFGTMAESGKNNKIYLREWSAFFSSAICHQPRKQHKKTKKKLHVAEATFPM